MELAMVTGRQTARRLIQKRSLPTRPALQDSPQLRLSIRRDRTMPMKHMLAFSIQPSVYTSNKPSVAIDVGRNKTWFAPANALDDSYWICIIDAKNPRVMVKDFVVPAGIDTYMNDPEYIFVVATQTLSTLHVPQGAFFDFLTKYGASRELQKLEQLNVVYGCGNYGHVSYALTGQCGPRGPGKIAPISYEKGSIYANYSALIMMSLMPGANGAPPYALCDSYTWTSP
jgi:hypothetical protein